MIRNIEIGRLFCKKSYILFDGFYWLFEGSYYDYYTYDSDNSTKSYLINNDWIEEPIIWKYFCKGEQDIRKYKLKKIQEHESR